MFLFFQVKMNRVLIYFRKSYFRSCVGPTSGSYPPLRRSRWPLDTWIWPHTHAAAVWNPLLISAALFGLYARLVLFVVSLSTFWRCFGDIIIRPSKPAPLIGDPTCFAELVWLLVFSRRFVFPRAENRPRGFGDPAQRKQGSDGGDRQQQVPLGVHGHDG